METLYPFQEIGANFLASRKTALLADQPGLGKTIQAIAALNLLKAKKILILCPASLRILWKRELEKWLDKDYLNIFCVFQADVTIPQNADIVICSYDLIGYGGDYEKKEFKGSAIYNQITGRRFAVNILDECFHFNTLVETQWGPKKIGQLKVGDHILNCQGEDTVTGVYFKKVDHYFKIRYNGQTIKVSPNHPFLTDEGWKPVSELKKGDKLVETSATPKMLRDMQQGILHKDKKTAFLQYLLFRDMASYSTRFKECIYRFLEKKYSFKPGETLEEFQFSEEKRSGENPSQSDTTTEQEAITETKPDSSKNKMETSYPRRQRTKTTDRAKQTLETFRQDLEDRICDWFEELFKGLPHELQSGFGFTFKADCRGSGRAFSSHISTSKARREKESGPKYFRVESITLHKCRNNGKPGKSSKENTFVDLSIENHPSFTVGGALVHNCHYLKNRDALRTKIILTRGGLASKSLYKWFLTGTPILNRPSELFPILKSSAPDAIAPFTSYTSYTRYFCGGYLDSANLWWDKGATHTEELNSRLTKNFMLRRTKDEVLPELPEKVFQVVPLPQTPATKKLVSEEFRWDEKVYTGKVSIPSGTAIATHRQELGIAKTNHCISWITEVLESERKVIVFAHHREVIRLLTLGLANYNPVVITGATNAKDRQDCVDDFQNDPTVRVFIGNIKAAGEGITLTAARHVVFAEPAWVPGEINQAADRCHRIGQKNSVLIQFLVVENSLEERIMQAVIDKTKIIKSIIGD